MSDELGGGGGYEAGSVYIGIEADTSPLDNLPEQIAAKISGIGAISVPFDHEPLRAGNAHIESKFEHVLDVNRRLAQNAIKPLYDGSSIQQLSSDLRSLQAQIDLVQTKIQLEATLNADAVRSQLDEIASQPRVIRYVTEVQGPDPQSIYGTGQSKAKANPSAEGLGDAIAPELKKAFKDASKEFGKGNIFGGIASFVTAPLRAVGSLATEAIGGAVFGAGQQLTSGFAKGLTNSLSGKLAGSVGSPELLGEKSGDLIANFAGFARKSIVNKAKAANVAIDKAIEVGTLEFGNFSIPLDILGINKADLRSFKEELTTAVRTSVEEYLEEFEQIFPEVQREAEAAAQRNKVRRRRQSVEKVAPQQIIDENQEAIQQLTRQRARGNTILSNKSVEADAIRDEVRVNRREAAQILKQIIRAETNGEIREQLIRLAAEDIPTRFQGQINKLQRAYGETIEKINQKNAEIAREESESAALGIKPNPEIKSQRLEDIQRLRAQAEKQQQDIRLQESIVQQEIDQYLSAATGEIDFAPILVDLKNQAIEQIKSLGEPLLQIQKEKTEVEQALRAVNAEIAKLTDSSISVSSPIGKRFVLEGRLKEQKKSLASIQSDISSKQIENESLVDQGSFSKKDADLFTTNVRRIAELEKKQQRVQKQILRTQTDLEKVPQQNSQAVRDLFKEIFSELGFRGKEPEVIVDTVSVTKKNANAYYDSLANAVVIKAELNDAITKGRRLTDGQKSALREEIIHSVQLDGGSAKALENMASSFFSGEQVQSVTKASTPTPSETRRLSSELDPYRTQGKGLDLEIELEAKVLRDRLAAREKQQSVINRIKQDLNNKGGFSGTSLEAAYSKYFSEFLSEVQSIKQIEGIDASEPLNRYIDLVSSLSASSKQYLDQLARLNLGQVDAAEAIQIESSFDKQVEDISNIYRAKESLVQEIQQLTQSKSEALVFPERADAELVPVQRQERQTVGGAISAVTSGVVVPTAQRAGDAVVAVGKAGYKAAEALEALVLDLIPAGRSLKATTKFAAKNIALPTGAAIAASQIPAIGGLEQVAIGAAGDLVHQLVGLTRTGILSQVQSIVSAAVPSFIPGSQNIVSIVSERIAALATGALDATGTATAEGLATVLSGSAVLNVLKKGVNTGIAQASRALPAAGQAILDTPQAQAISKAQIPFELPTRDRVLEVAEDLGAAARIAEDKTIQFAENALKGLRLLTAQIPEGRELIDLGLDELQAIKRKLAARFDEVAQAEREGKPVLAGRDVVRGDIKRVQQVIDAKSQPVIEVPQVIEEKTQPIRVSKTQYENDLKKVIQSESKQIEKLRSQLIENLRQGSTSDALRIAEQLKASSQSALGKLETFKGNTNLDLEPAIRKSVNGYITRFKDLIAQAENATAKISNDEDFSSLLSIDTQQIAEKFVGLINNLFEVEGKNLEDALKKAAVSPRAKDLYVNTAGFAASQVGAQLGPVPQLAGDLGGALVARQAINIGEQAIAARSELLEDELYQSANAIKKLKMVAQKTAEKLQSVELQKILGSNLSEDVAGFSIGNIAAALGQGAVPGVGAAAAMATVPKLSELRKYINERITASQGDGEEDLGILKSISNGPFYSNKDIEVLKQLADELAEIERLTKQIEAGQERIRKIESDTTKLEQINRRNLRFDTVGQDQNQRAAAQEVERIKARNKAEADAEKARRDRLTQSDISTVLSNAKPRTQPDRLAQAKLENERENAGRAQSSRARQDSPIDRLAAIKAEAEAQQQSLTSRLEAINVQRAAESNATNERLAEIKAEAEAQKQLQQDRLVQSLESQKNQGIRERLTASQQPKPKEDLAQYLTRVPGTAGGGNGPRVPGPPTLFIPEIQPRVTAFDVAKRAASGFLGIVEKIPAPIKNLFFLLGGGFAGFQAFQILTNQANQSYEAIKRLESARVVVNFATGNTNALATAEKQATLLGTKLTESREAIKSLAIQTKNTPLEQKIVPIFEGATTAAAALQLNPEQQSRLFLAFNQIAGKGTVQSEELRQQLGELGVSFQLAARAAGLTTTEFNKQLSQGAVLSQDFLPKFAAQLKLELGGAAISAGDSLQGLENKAGNAAQRLQEGLGQRSIPVISTGLKSFAGILDFAANNVQTLTNLINVALVAALLKGGQAFKAFAFEQQTFSTKDALGNITSVSQSSRAGRFARGARDFVSGGGIQRALQSELAQDLKGLAVQTAVISAGIGAFQTIAEGFSGGERYQEFNKVLETTEKRIKAIESAERDRLNLAGKKEGRTFEQVRNDLAQTGAGAIGDLVSLDFKGFNKKVARNFQQLLGGDPTTALSEGPLATQEQADNRRILNNASDLLESKKFQEERNKAFSLAGQLKNNVKVNPDELKASRETIQSRLDVLKAVPEDLRKIRPEIDAEIKSLEKLQAALGGTGSAYSTLVKAAQNFENIILKQIELDKLATSLDSSRARASGYISEFEAKASELEAQAKAAAKSKDEIKKLLDASNAFLAGEEYAALKISDPEKAEAELKRNLEFKSQFMRSDKEIEDTIIQQRLEAINRRSELLQREVAEQERAIAKLESLRKIRTTKRDAGLAEGVANQSLTPQALRLQQPLNAVGDAQDAIVEQEKKRQNALKNLKKARADLSQINPNDGQQFEQGKAAVAQYEQAVLAAEAEINTQRKAGAEAATQYRSEIEDQIRTQIDLTVRKNEQAVTKEIQGIDRLGNAQKRRIDDAVAGYQREQKSIDFIITALDRAAKISNKRAELNSAINQGRQIPLAGLAGEIRDAEGLIAKLKDKNLDPGVRSRTQGVLNQLGISNNEQDAFRYRIKIEDKIARLKADSLSAEIEQSQITLDIEERKETFAAKRAIIEAEITKQQAEQAALAAQIDRRKAESEVRKSDIGVQKATAQLQLAQLSGDPNKVREAELNLEDAKLSQSAAQDTLLGAKQSEKLAREALPNATLSVVDALENFAATIETGKLSRRILAATNQNKVSQFNTEERGRVRGLAIEGIDKGVEVNIASGSANGFDPFGFRASRAKDEMARQEDIRRFQNNIKGIPNGALPSRGLSGSVPGLNTPTYKAQEQKPLDFGGLRQSPQQAMDKAMEMAAMPINFAPVTDMLARLVTIEERLSAQILTLAGRQQVQVNNTANYAVREPILSDTNL